MRTSAAGDSSSACHLQNRSSVKPRAGYGSREFTQPRAGGRDVLLPGCICAILYITPMWGLGPVFQTLGNAAQHL